MPSKHSLNVSLTEHLSGFVEEQVVSGYFRTASEVVRAALRLLERDLRGPPSAIPRSDGSGTEPQGLVIPAQNTAEGATTPRRRT
jgi:antitoxin ParD1/3/4